MKKKALGVIIAAAGIVTISTILLADIFSNYSTNDIAIDDVDVGLVNCGDQTSFSASIKNCTESEFIVVGKRACCGTKLTEYPSIVEPKASGVIAGLIYVPLEPDPFETRIKLYGDWGGLKVITFKVHGTAVVAVAPGEQSIVVRHPNDDL